MHGNCLDGRASILADVGTFMPTRNAAIPGRRRASSQQAPGERGQWEAGPRGAPSGRTSAAIRKLLDLTPKTAESYRGRIMEKLDIHDTAGLVRYAIRQGLIQP